MGRIRSIHPDACDSTKLAACSADAERLFWRLQTHCDDEGRCEDNPRLICARCLPLVDGWDARHVDLKLAELATCGLLVRYEGDGVACIQVMQWDRFQHPQKPKKSTLPAHDDTRTVPVPYESSSPTVPVASGEEGRGVGEGGEGTPSLVLVNQEPDTTFAEFWSLYPRKVGKDAAESAWRKALKRTTGRQILASLHAHLPALEANEQQFRPHASTWLNQSRWSDEPEDPAESDALVGALTRANSRGVTQWND